MAILLRLVQVTLDGAFVRRIAAFDELTSIGPAEDIRRILHVLAAARLVVVSSDVYFQNARVDLAHEAIIRSWPRLRDQIEGLAQFLRLRTRLEVATQRWQERNKESGFLYPAGEILLLKSQGLLQRYWSELSPAEQGFIAASEYALQRDQRRRLVMALTVWSLFVLMAVAAVFAFLQLLRAQRESASAGAAATRAQEEASRAVTEARLAALANLGAASAISPDGMRMLQINPAGDLSIIDLATGKETGRVAGGSNGITAAAFSADARLVATGTIGGTISIYDSSTLKLLGTSAGHSHAVRRLAFSPAGRLIASGSDDATARIWLVDNWMAVATIAADSPVVGVAFSPDGTRLIVTSQKGSLYIVDAQTGKIVFRNPG
jgi:hypothetical protein